MFVRRSTTRDFRIDASVLSKRIENRDVGGGEEEGEGEKEKARPSKRRKKE